MKLKKFVRFVMLLFFFIIAAIVPIPISFHKKDNLPTYEIEQLDKKKDEDDESEEYQAFS
ncbi:hypothetical protein [Flagellimonas okinawensis]|uniref:Uncharacterized protein n=1 Tax=Flagellimonas okinawensis TaxID=3031324 RepID=A0ABT5XRF6_9FLAO|nr:hypothetical protein [[Muricauda] okinawensis]MDF0708484.1 hypothetical protein [[Muricauda] okinawensis]